MRAPLAAMANGSSGPRSSRRPSSARWHRASRRSCIACSIRRRSRRQGRSTSCGRRQRRRGRGVIARAPRSGERNDAACASTRLRPTAVRPQRQDAILRSDGLAPAKHRRDAGLEVWSTRLGERMSACGESSCGLRERPELKPAVGRALRPAGRRHARASLELVMKSRPITFAGVRPMTQRIGRARVTARCGKPIAG